MSFIGFWFDFYVFWILSDFDLWFWIRWSWLMIMTLFLKVKTYSSIAKLFIDNRVGLNTMDSPRSQTWVIVIHLYHHFGYHHHCHCDWCYNHNNQQQDQTSVIVIVIAIVINIIINEINAIILISIMIIVLIIMHLNQTTNHPHTCISWHTVCPRTWVPWWSPVEARVLSFEQCSLRTEHDVWILLYGL